ncbi:MAG: hypothetical protein HRT57_18085, partial [Crocinitomicaceae bacterium]|nr:hypothetical protein [Crocinitomicaceae bacterium]
EDLSDGKKIVWIGLDERVGKYAKTDWDIYVRLVGRTKKTSVIRGDVFVYDLFNKVKYIQEYDITIPLKHDELTKGEMLEFGGMRFKSQRYSEVKRDWDWLRGAKKENMKVRYVVRSIAYADGSVESFK